MHEWQTRRSTPPLADLLSLFVKICGAVHAAHLAGVTHRDLCPSNILLDDRGEPHVLDFGLARTAFDRFITGSSKNITLTEQFLGRLEYASPEQARCAHESMDIRSDVYSLGVMLYQLITGGRFPYSVEGRIGDAMSTILRTAPVPPQVNDQLDAIVLKALAKSAQERYQSAGELARDVQSHRDGTLSHCQPPWGPPARRVTWPRLMIAAAALFIFGGVLFSVSTRPVDPLTIHPHARVEATDLLRRVRLTEDALSGVWESTGQGYFGRSQSGGRLRLRSNVRGAYDVRFTFSKPGSMVGLRFTFGGRRFVWYLDVSHGIGTGFGVADDAKGGDVWLPGSPARQAPRFEADSRYTALLQIRHDAFIGHINGQPVIRWNIDPSILRLEQDWTIEAEGLEFVCQFDGYLHAAEAISVPDAPGVVAARPGSVLPQTDPPPPVQLGSPVDLLALADLSEAISAEYWKRTDQGFVSLTSGVGSVGDPQILRIPYRVQGEYDLRVAFTYQRQPGLLLVLLSHRGKRFNFVTQGGSAGFFPVNGAHAHENRSSLLQWNAPPDGAMQTLILQIRDQKVRAELNGRLISEMTTDFSDLDDTFRHTGPIGEFDFGIYATSATLHAAELIPVRPSPGK
jgi:hypothetical protein